jgi:hypothetical protein
MFMHKENLAKFGYKPNWKIKTFENPLYIFLLLVRTCCKNLAIFFNLQVWQIRLHFFHNLLSFLFVEIALFKLKICAKNLH